MKVNLSIMVTLNSSNYNNLKGKIKDLLFVKQFHLLGFISKKFENKYDKE